MGIKDFFRKKEPELDLGSNLGLDTSSDFGLGKEKNFGNEQGMDFNQGMQNEQFQPAVNLSTQQFQPAQSQGPDVQKDLQILSLKLDAIKSELDTINQRIKNIETIAEKEQQQTKKWY